MKYLIEALGAWGSSISVVVCLAIIFIVMQVTGEIIEWTGKVSPKILKIRKIFKEHKMKRLHEKKQLEKLDNLVNLLEDVQTTLTSVNAHYNSDNITQRDNWMAKVNENIEWTRDRAITYDASVADLVNLKDSVDKLSEYTCKQIKESYRNRILDFQHRIINAKGKSEPERFSHEEFNKIYATYEDYEEFLEYTNDTNHQVDNAMKTIEKAERGELPNIVFID